MELPRTLSQSDTDRRHLELRQRSSERTTPSARDSSLWHLGQNSRQWLPESSTGLRSVLENPDGRSAFVVHCQRWVSANADRYRASEVKAQLDKQALQKTIQGLERQLNQAQLDKQATKRTIQDLHCQLDQAQLDKQALQKTIQDLKCQLDGSNESHTRGKHSKNILVLFTGGTIGSVRLSDGRIVQPSEARDCGVDAGDAKSLLLDGYHKQYSDPNTNFHTEILMETLSENMTLEKVAFLAAQLKRINFHDYDGIVLTHGTDTLAFTASYLSMLLADIKVPMILVSSNFVVTDEKANGIKNLKGAVDFISNVELPGVYVTYHYEGKTKVIYGSRVMQCKPITDDFDSISIGKKSEKNMCPLGIINEDGEFEVLDKKLFENLEKRRQAKRDGSGSTEKDLTAQESPQSSRSDQAPNISDCQDHPSSLIHYQNANLLDRIESLKSRILVITPYVGLDYNNFNLDNIDVVLHTTYHSGTACTSGTNENVLEFRKKCEEKNVDFYFGPLYGDAGRDVYSSTDKIDNSGDSTIMNVSSEIAYLKLWIAYALFKDKQERDQFIRQNINEEFVKPASKLERKCG
jgi:L-asparaginase